jgi:rRNA maturation endonuclease Nob1
VVDANALIKQIPLRQVINPSLTTEDEFDRMYEVFTLQEVVGEIRDERARSFLANLPYKMEVKGSECIDQEDLRVVEEFAKETGDFQSLSRVDLLVIAFGLTLARQKGELLKVRKQPPSF